MGATKCAKKRVADARGKFDEREALVISDTKKRGSLGHSRQQGAEKAFAAEQSK